MKPAAEPGSRDAVQAIVKSQLRETRPPPYLSLSRDAVRDPRLDHGGLCGFIDTQHPGLAGVEFYRPCDEARLPFEIMCDPEFNNRRPCSEGVFIGDHIGLMLSYQIEMLSHRDEIIEAVRKVIVSWERSPRRNRSLP